MTFVKGMAPYPLSVKRPTALTLDEARYHLIEIEDRLKSASHSRNPNKGAARDLKLLRDAWAVHVERLTNDNP